MTERLAQLFVETAEDVRAPQLAETAWVQAGRVRRRNRVAMAGAAAVLAATVGVGVTLLPTGRGSAPDRTGTPTGTPSLSPEVHQMPASLAAHAPGPLPTTIPDFRSITRSAVGMEPVMLVQPYADGSRPEPVYVWSGTSWGRLDGLNLQFVRDAGGNQAYPLRSTSVSPGGGTIAFPQPDEVVLVEVSDGSTSRLAAPGFNEHVLWLNDSMLLVGGDEHSYTVDIRRHTATPAGFDSMWDLAAGSNGVVDELGASVLTTWRLDGTAPLADRPIDDFGLAPYGVLEWYGRGWRQGGFVVRGAWGHSANEHGMEMLGVVDVQTGVVVRLLPFGMGRYKSCCEPLGWLDAQTVLFRNDPFGLAGWNIETGKVTQITGPVAGPASAAIAVLGRP